MLSLRPSCENCNTPLPANSNKAMICSYECTFCQHCAEEILLNVCPNCGGGFCARPIRPKTNLKNGNFLGHHPASVNTVHRPVDIEAHQNFAEEIRFLDPAKR